MNAQVADIDGFIISYAIPGESPVPAYHYPIDDIPEVTTDGITFANNIPLSNWEGDEIELLVVTIVSRVINPSSNSFITLQCGAVLDSTEISTGSSGRLLIIFM